MSNFFTVTKFKNGPSRWSPRYWIAKYRMRKARLGKTTVEWFYDEGIKKRGLSEKVVGNVGVDKSNI